MVERRVAMEGRHWDIFRLLHQLRRKSINLNTNVNIFAKCGSNMSQLQGAQQVVHAGRDESGTRHAENGQLHS